MLSKSDRGSSRRKTRGRSLGAGSLSIDGGFVLSFFGKINSNDTVGGSATAPAPKSLEELGQRNAAKIDASFRKGGPSMLNLLPTATREFLRQNSSFLRVADLKIDSRTSLTDVSESTSDMSYPNFSCVSVDPPPGIDYDPDELWVMLDDGAGSHSPIAPLALEALAKTGLDCVLDDSMWTCYKSPKQMKAVSFYSATWQPHGKVALQNHGSRDDEETILLWSGKFQHGGYGSDLPAVRAAGIIHSSAKELFDLMVDSSRVKEYNNLSLGREDKLVLQDDLHNDGPFGRSITKVMRSRSAPPLIRKTMELDSILYARELQDGSGYLLVSRAVTLPEHAEGGSSNSLRSEMLMGVNLIRRVEGDANKCLMVNVTHLRSPMVPLFIANKIGATAAANFIRDIRGIRA